MLHHQRARDQHPDKLTQGVAKRLFVWATHFRRQPLWPNWRPPAAVPATLPKRHGQTPAADLSTRLGRQTSVQVAANPSVSSVQA